MARRQVNVVDIDRDNRYRAGDTPRLQFLPETNELPPNLRTAIIAAFISELREHGIEIPGGIPETPLQRLGPGPHFDITLPTGSDLQTLGDFNSAREAARQAAVDFVEQFKAETRDGAESIESTDGAPSPKPADPKTDLIETVESVEAICRALRVAVVRLAPERSLPKSLGLTLPGLNTKIP